MPYVLHHHTSVTFALAGGSYGKVFKFINSLPLASDYGYGFCFAFFFHDEQVAPFYIAVYHRLLFIGQKQQVKETFLVRFYKSNMHGSFRDD
jgi:hypothetical protein